MLSPPVSPCLPLSPRFDPSPSPCADHSPRDPPTCPTRPLLHLRVMFEMKMNVFRIAINTPTIPDRVARLPARAHSPLRNEQVIAMARIFIIISRRAFDYSRCSYIYMYCSSYARDCPDSSRALNMNIFFLSFTFGDEEKKSRVNDRLSILDTIWYRDLNNHW